MPDAEKPKRYCSVPSRMPFFSRISTQPNSRMFSEMSSGSATSAVTRFAHQPKSFAMP